MRANKQQRELAVEFRQDCEDFIKSMVDKYAEIMTDNCQTISHNTTKTARLINGRGKCTLDELKVSQFIIKFEIIN